MTFNILTQSPVVIDLSRPAMERVIDLIENAECQWALEPHVQCEVDNFRNLLQNLLDRSEPKTGNLDLIGD